MAGLILLLIGIGLFGLAGHWREQEKGGSSEKHAGVFLYGFAAFRLGGQGPILGWPIFMSSTILTACVLGVLAGEWEGVAGKSPRLMKVALLTMIVALFVIARSG